MKTCPICKIDLTPSDYEGFRVFRCDQCRGHLVPAARVDSIKRLGVKPADDLKAEAAEFKGAAPGPLRCPACRRPMHKNVLGPSGHSVSVDVCPPCSLAWFDAGELALLQMSYEASDRFADAQEMKQRAARLESSPARKAAFEENLAALPDRPSPLEEAVTEAAEDALLRGSKRSFLDLLRLFWPLLWVLALSASQAFADSPPWPQHDEQPSLVPSYVVAVLLAAGLVVFFRRVFRCRTCGKQTKPWRRFSEHEKQVVESLIPETQKALLVNPDIRVCPSCGTVERVSAGRNGSASVRASLPHTNDISEQYKAWGDYMNSQKDKKP